ncbi:MAG: DUF4838 domain-containing protein [Armatimonadota bacterium]|nr:DUF4838 domain-containing protein [Armatimonadota bacterium]
MLIWRVTLIFLILSIGCSAGAAEMLLSAKGKPLAAIVVPSDAIPSERTAGIELAKHLKMVTGADFPIVTSAGRARQKTRIYIGQTKTAKRLMPGFDFGKLGRDGIVIRKNGGDLVLAGDRPRGTLYAVYTFLEDTVGCKWWTADASYIPKKPTLRVKVKDLTYAPPFMCRETFYKNMIGNCQEFAPKLKLNGHFQYISGDWGGHYSILGFCHTFYQLIPPAKYFADHPEWFSEIDGRRTAENAQLCLTNEELRKELTKNALEWIKKNPDAGMLDISQNDSFRPCQCAKCRAIVQRTGAESGPVVAFVNAVAQDVEKQYPGFLVQTLAYLYTRKPPTHIKPRHNVVVRLCSIECDFAKPLTAPTNTKFYKDLMGWKAISSHLYVWDYTVGFGNLMMPNANFRVLAPNVRLFAKSNVIGVFEQGDGYNPDADFDTMKTWLLAHLMWNPKADESALMNEFLTGYYGPAGKYMREYIDLICDAVQKSGQRLTWANTTYDYLTPEVLNRAAALFDTAEKAVAGNPELVRRLARQRAAVDQAIVLTSPAPGLPKGDELRRTLDRFLTVADQTGNNFRQEGQVMSAEFRQYLKDKASGNPYPVAYDATKASSLAGYSDEDTFAGVRKTMTEIFDLPKDGWKFTKDKPNTGAKKGFYLADFADSSWRPFSIGKFWEEQGEDYNGRAWYRLRFTAPTTEPGKRVFLVFGAADDAALVWLNETFVAERHVGWDNVFALDVTHILKQGQENTLAVQVIDTGGFGGLWKSVKLMVK